MQKLWLEVYGLETRSEKRWYETIRLSASSPGVFLDLGSGKPFQGVVNPGDLGPLTSYISLDIFEPAHPQVVADIHHLPIGGDCVHTILCSAVLEHVPDPESVIIEMHRVLQTGGRLFVAVPFIYPFHDRTDYYRFTDMALQKLFSRFSEVKIVPLGDYFYAALLFLMGFSFTLARWLRPLLVAPRLFLRAIVWILNRLPIQESQRDYLRSLPRSPVGWYVYCRKP